MHVTEMNPRKHLFLPCSAQTSKTTGVEVSMESVRSRVFTLRAAAPIVSPEASTKTLCPLDCLLASPLPFLPRLQQHPHICHQTSNLQSSVCRWHRPDSSCQLAQKTLIHSLSSPISLPREPDTPSMESMAWTVRCKSAVRPGSVASREAGKLHDCRGAQTI